MEKQLGTHTISSSIHGQMKTWSKELIRNSYSHPTRLLEKRVASVCDKNQYINAYEYALFTDVDTCQHLSKCLHAHGLTINDVITPYYAELALINDNLHNYAALAKIKWNTKTFRGVLKRPDAIQLLRRKDYDMNGFEFGITIMPKTIGTLISKHKINIADVIRFTHFKKCESIKQLFI